MRAVYFPMLAQLLGWIAICALGATCKVPIRGGQADVSFIKIGPETLVFKRFLCHADWDNEVAVLQMVDDCPFILQPLQADRERKELVYRHARDSDLFLARGLECLSLAQMVILCRKIILAVTALHRRGYLHMDIKPENIVRDGVDLWLIDLGLATPIGKACRSIGTPRTMAPESLFPQLCKLKLGCGSDWWSVGVTIYYIFSRYYHRDLADIGRHCGHFPYRVLWSDDSEPVRLEWALCPPRFPRPLLDLLFGCNGLLTDYQSRYTLTGEDLLRHSFFNIILGGR